MPAQAIAWTAAYRAAGAAEWKERLDGAAKYVAACAVDFPAEARANAAAARREHPTAPSERAHKKRAPLRA